LALAFDLASLAALSTGAFLGAMLLLVLLVLLLVVL
jgi:hypothetical protein